MFAISVHLTYQPRQNILLGVTSFAVGVYGIFTITIIEHNRGRHSLPRSKMFGLFLPQIIQESFEGTHFTYFTEKTVAKGVGINILVTRYQEIYLAQDARQ